ncbi:MAG: radical SAM family heme chaperone HemW [Spirochaetales bacterium]|nr:radical SAM family heme chaperone HemW [Spirochaetales bacterium]
MKPEAAAALSASLYIHIPFCARKCAYCDFYSVASEAAAETPRVMRAVLEAEIRQFDYYREHWRLSEIPTLYIGGGTPCLIPPPLLEKFLAEITRRLPAPAPGEFTIEANPESLSEDFLHICAAAGLTRISLGLQSFDPRCLETLGRRAGPADNRRALRLLDRCWKGELSLDLMYGIPGQTSRAALADAAEALERGPGHISLYALTPEEGTPLYADILAGKTPAPAETRQEFIRGKVHKLLLDKGYENYEISSYALPGKRCRHNAAYWNLMPYMGIGPAAVSTLPEETGPVRLSGIRDLGAYTKGPCLSETELLSPRDFLADYILLGLRTSGGIDIQTFAQIFHLDFFETFSDVIYKNRRFAVKNSGRSGNFTLTDRGRRILNMLLLDFLGAIDALKYEGPLRWPLG